MSTYRSPRRQLQAEATKRDIVRAARQLFAQRGYAATSMTDIARQAGVAVQTVYASCGSKRDLILALVDFIDEEADVAGAASQWKGVDDPREIVRIGVGLTRQLNERCGDIIGALLSAAALDSDVAAAAQEGSRRHRDGCARVAHRLYALGALRDGMNADEAAALLSALTWQPVYRRLVTEHGLSFDDCQRLLTNTLTSALLR